MRYQVVLEQGPTSVGASVPDLPGCVAIGANRDEAMELIRVGIGMHIEGLRAAGNPVPTPLARLEVVEIDAA